MAPRLLAFFETLIKLHIFGKDRCTELNHPSNLTTLVAHILPHWLRIFYLTGCAYFTSLVAHILRRWLRISIRYPWSCVGCGYVSAALGRVLVADMYPLPLVVAFSIFQSAAHVPRQFSSRINRSHATYSLALEPAETISTGNRRMNIRKIRVTDTYPSPAG